MRLVPFTAALGIAVCSLPFSLAAISHAQDGGSVASPGRVPQDTRRAGESAALLRTRATSAWRNYVWSLNRERLKYSVEDLERARALSDGRADFTQIYLVAFGHLVLGDVEPGRAAAAEARTRNGEFVPLSLLDAFESMLTGDRERALETLDEFAAATELMPADQPLRDEFRYLAYLHRGALRYDMGQHGEAAADLQKAIQITRDAGREPASVVMLRLARAHQALDEHGAAADLVRQLLRRDPANADLYYNLGLLEGTQKHLPEARAWYERAIARESDHGEAQGKLAFVAWRDADTDPGELRRMRSQLSAYGELSQGSSVAVTLADVESGHGLYWMTVARHRIDHGFESCAASAYERALAHFEAAVRHEPGCVRALNSIIQIGAELRWPEERIRPYRERLNAILQNEDGAPRSQRSSFC